MEVLRKRILLSRDVDCRIANDTGDRGRLRKTLLFDQPLEGPIAAATGRDLEGAYLDTASIANPPDVEALQEPAPGDVLGQILDRDTGLRTPDVRLAEDQLVEGNVARDAEGNLLNGLCHVVYSATDSRETLSRLENPSQGLAPPLPLLAERWEGTVSRLGRHEVC